MELLIQQIAGIITICVHALLSIGIIKNRIEQSFVAFMLWAMLDIIATITTILEDGNYWLPLANAVGASAIAVILAIKKQVSWSRIETMTSVLVIVCMIIWFVAGEKAGIISSSLAVVIASIPQMAETYKKPTTTPTIIYVMFLIANILSFIVGKSWTIEERFYSGCGVFLCSVIVLLSLKKTSKAVRVT